MTREQFQKKYNTANQEIKSKQNTKRVSYESALDKLFSEADNKYKKTRDRKTRIALTVGYVSRGLEKEGFNRDGFIENVTKTAQNRINDEYKLDIGWDAVSDNNKSYIGWNAVSDNINKPDSKKNIDSNKKLNVVPVPSTLGKMSYNAGKELESIGKTTAERVDNAAREKYSSDGAEEVKKYALEGLRAPKTGTAENSAERQRLKVNYVSAVGELVKGKSISEIEALRDKEAQKAKDSEDERGLILDAYNYQIARISPEYANASAIKREWESKTGEYEKLKNELDDGDERVKEQLEAATLAAIDAERSYGLYGDENSKAALAEATRRRDNLSALSREYDDKRRQYESGYREYNYALVTLSNYKKIAETMYKADFKEKSRADDSIKNQMYRAFNALPRKGVTFGAGQGETDAYITYEDTGKLLTDDEKKVYNYIYKTEGKKSAEKYIDSIKPLLDLRKAEDIGIDGGMFEGTMWSISSGLEGGVKNIEAGVDVLRGRKKDYYFPTTSQMVAAEYSENATGFEKGLYNTAAAVSGQIVPFALSFVPGAGPWLSRGAFFLQAFGGSFTQSVNEGKNTKDAYVYSLYSASMEFASEMTIGGLSYMGKSGLSRLSSTAAGTKFVSRAKAALDGVIKSDRGRAAMRIASSYIADGLSEFGEEYISSTMDPLARNFFYGEDNDFTLMSDSQLEDAAAGFFSAIILNAPRTTVNSVRVLKNDLNSKLYIINTDGTLSEQQKKEKAQEVILSDTIREYYELSQKYETFEQAKAQAEKDGFTYDIGRFAAAAFEIGKKQTDAQASREVINSRIGEGIKSGENINATVKAILSDETLRKSAQKALGMKLTSDNQSRAALRRYINRLKNGEAQSKQLIPLEQNVRNMLAEGASVSQIATRIDTNDGMFYQLAELLGEDLSSMAAGASDLKITKYATDLQNSYIAEQANRLYPDADSRLDYVEKALANERAKEEAYNAGFKGQQFSDTNGILSDVSQKELKTAYSAGAGDRALYEERGEIYDERNKSRAEKLREQVNAENEEFLYSESGTKTAVSEKKQLNPDVEKAVSEILTETEEQTREKLENRTAVRIMDETPNVILKNVEGAKNLPIVMNYSKLYLAAREDGIIKDHNAHYHNLGNDVSKILSDTINDPDAIIRLDNGRLNLLSYVETERGNNVLLSVELNSVKDIAGRNNEYNAVVTLFTANDNYLENLLKKPGTTLEYKKENLPQVNPQLNKMLATINGKSSSNNSIRKNSGNVNSSSENNSTVEQRGVFNEKEEKKGLEDENYSGYGVYGRGAADDVRAKAAKALTMSGVNKTKAARYAADAVGGIYRRALEGKKPHKNEYNGILTDSEAKKIYQAASKDKELRDSRAHHEDAKIIKDEAFKEAKVSFADERVLTALAEITGLNIRFEQLNGKNAYIDIANGEIVISTRARNPVKSAIIHEVIHDMRVVSPSDYNALEAAICDFLDSKKADAYNILVGMSYRDEIFDENGNPVEGWRERITEEKVCDLYARVISNEALIRKLGRKNAKGLLKVAYAIMDFADSIRYKIKMYFSSPDLKDASVAYRALSRRSESMARGFINALESAYSGIDNEVRAKEKTEGKKGEKPTADGVRNSRGLGTNGSQNGNYDYSKPFSQQVDDFKKGLIPKRDTLVVSETPEVFRKIGFNALPITINQTHVDYVVNGTKDADHFLGEALLKQLPDVIKQPLAIIRSQSIPGRVVAILKFNSNGKECFAPIEIDGVGQTNNIMIDSNTIVSLYAKSSSLQQLSKALNDEANGTISLFYWNKKEAVSLLQTAGLQLPGFLPQNGFAHSIRENGSNVNVKIKNVTYSKQFKRWFGDWENNPQNASKVVNDDGTPKVVYHGTDADFNVFKSDDGNFWFSESRDYAEAMSEERNGKRIIECYLNMKNPYYATLEPNRFSDPNYEAPIIREAKKKGHDGVIIKNNADDEYSTDTFYVVFNPTQIKSATDNIGTFDKNNPDMRYSKILGNGDSITKKDVEAVQSIGRKSVNDFTGEDIKKSEAFARRYFKEMGVKSPFFRAWFGDWRANDTTKVNTVFVDTKANNISRGVFKNKDTNWEINVSSVGIGDTISHSGKEKLSVLALNNIDIIIQNAILLDSEVSTQTGKKGANTIFMHKLYVPTNIGGKSYISKVSVEEYSSGNDTNKRFYNLKEIKISPALGGLSTNNTASTMRISDDKISISELFDIVKTSDKNFSPKPVNPVFLNDDGTPKVFYHGTSEKFTVFDMDKGRSRMDIQGAFFSPWEIDAAGYGENVGAFYLNIKNPASEGVAYKALNMFKGQNYAGRKAREYLINLGYDGVNNSDEEYIAFYPEQIKSATDNIGTFDKNNPDIRYSNVLDDSVEITEEDRIRESALIQKKKSVERWRTGYDFESGKKVEIKPLNVIVKQMADAFKLPVSSGKYAGEGKAPHVQYSKFEKTLRTAFKNDLPAVCSGIALHLDVQLDLSGDILRSTQNAIEKSGDARAYGVYENELSTLVNDYDGTAKMTTGALCEFIRRYIINPDEAKKECPLFGELFEKKLGESEELSEAVNKCRDSFLSYARLSSGERFGAAILTQKEFDKLTHSKLDDIKAFLPNAYTDIVDSFNPIKAAIRRAGGDFKDGNGGYVLATNSVKSTAQANFILEEAMTDMNGKRVGESFKVILEDVLRLTKEQRKSGLTTIQKRRDFSQYLVMRHAPEWLEKTKAVTQSGKKVSSGVKRVFADESINDPEECRKRAAELEAKYPEFKQLAQRVYDFQNKLIENWIIPSGAQSREQIEKLRALYPNYVPFYRLSERADGKRRSSGVGRGFVNLKNPFQTAIGGGDVIKDPIEAIIMSVQKATDFARRNEVTVALAREFTGKDSIPGFMSRVYSDAELSRIENLSETTGISTAEDIFGAEGYDGKNKSFSPTVSGADGVVCAWVNGKKQYYKIYDAELYHALAGLAPQQIPLILRISKKALNLTRAAVTSFDPRFAINNFERDAQTFMHNSDTVHTPIGVVIHYLISLKNIVLKDEVYQTYRALGGGDSSRIRAELEVFQKKVKLNIKPRLRDMSAGEIAEKAVVELLKAPIYTIPKGIINCYVNANEVVETLPRLSEFRNRLKKGYDVQRAFYESQDVTTNFSRSGATGRRLNTVFLFSNAQVQGVDRFARTFKDASGAELAKRIGTYVMWSIMTTAIRRWWNRDDEAKEAYSHLSNYTKNNFICLYMGDGKFLKLSRAHEISIPETITNRLADFIFDGDEKAFEDFGGYVADNLLPPFIPKSLSLSDALYDLGSNTVIGPGVDILANRDFKGSQIVPDSMGYLEHEFEKYNNDTFDFSVWLSEALYDAAGYDISPLATEHFITSRTGWAGSLVTGLFPVSDVRGTGEKDDEEKGLWYSIKKNAVNSLGFTRRFVADSRYSTDILNAVYEQADKTSGKAVRNKTGENLLINEKWQKLKSFCSTYNKTSRKISGVEEQRDDRLTLLRLITGYDDTPSETDKYIIKLYDAVGADDIFINQYPSNTELKMTKKKVKYECQLTPEQYIEYCAEIDNITDAVRALVMESGVSDEKAVLILAKAKSKINANVKERFIEKYGEPVSDKKNSTQTAKRSTEKEKTQAEKQKEVKYRAEAIYTPIKQNIAALSKDAFDDELDKLIYGQ